MGCRSMPSGFSRNLGGPMPLAPVRLASSSHAPFNATLMPTDMALKSIYKTAFIEVCWAPAPSNYDRDGPDLPAGLLLGGGRIDPMGALGVGQAVS
jgi:hypothetical protein